MRESGNIRKCFDEFYEDFVISDELRKVRTTGINNAYPPSTFLLHVLSCVWYYYAANLTRPVSPSILFSFPESFHLFLTPSLPLDFPPFLFTFLLFSPLPSIFPHLHSFLSVSIKPPFSVSLQSSLSCFHSLSLLSALFSPSCTPSLLFSSQPFLQPWSKHHGTVVKIKRENALC